MGNEVMKTNRQRVTGFSLTEILVALVISSILMYGVVSIMVGSKRTYGLQNELAKLQDNARFIMEDMTFNLRMAGFRGCAGMNEKISAIFGNKNLIRGENNLIIEDVSGNKVSETFPKTDSLEVRFLGSPLEWYDHEQYSPLELKPTDKAYLSASSLRPAQHSWVLVGDCEKMEKVKVSESSPEEGQSEDAPVGTRYIKFNNPPLSATFKRPIDIFPVPAGGPSGVLYEVRADPVSGFVLYRNDPDQLKYEEPFVEGVENLQVRYGLERAGGLTYSDTPPKATDNVKSVKITLLMRTPQKRFDIKDTTEKEFHLDSALVYKPTDNLAFEKGYRHRLFTSVISIRNANFNK